jgi:hypothetical protein
MTRSGGLRGAPWRGLLATAAATYNTVLGETPLLSIAKNLTLQKTIVAKQLTGPDCADTDTPTSNGCNLDSDITCQLTRPSDKPNVTSPLLGPLQDNGGLTQTQALLPGSPAIDAGDPAGCTDNLGAPLTTAPRGFARPQDGHGDGRAICALGAYDRCNGIFETRCR